MTSTLSNVSARSAAFALYQLESPAVHPDSITRCIKSITQNKSALGSLAQIDPAAALAMLNLCRQSKIDFSFDNANFSAPVSKLSSQKILKTFLGLKTFDIDNLHSQIPIADFNRTSAARAFAARLIAAKTKANDGLSFFAALFADIGLLALAELYPKSLSQLLDESKGDNLTLLRLEKENLGLTHNIISRQLAQKWQLPQAVADSGWLYRTNAWQKLGNLANIEIISIVRFADTLVKSISNGDQIETIPAALSISKDDINEIKQQVRSFIQQLNAVQEKQESLVIREALISLVENQPQQRFSDFMSEVWPAVKPVSSAIEAAAIICRLICKIFDAQNTCIYLEAQKEAVKTIGEKSEFLTFEKSPSFEDIDFVSADTMRIKLDTIGELFVQTRQDLDISSIASVCGGIISAKFSDEHNFSIAQALVDDFSPLPKHEQPEKQNQASNDNEFRDIIAEIASGAAHELNNPLTVISGRAQLLMQSEADETKKLILNQIIEKTGQAYEIVGQLMKYAHPGKTQIRTVSPFIMVNNCLEKVNAHYLNEPLDISLENIENLSDIEVDAEQIAEAISQIIFNSLESYESGNGPVQIIGSERSGQEFIEITIKDSGCGMSDETLRRAAEPFYSDKPAGRQRGMGLALASSLLKNNNCTMTIESQIDSGTTIKICLPKTAKSENS